MQEIWRERTEHHELRVLETGYAEGRQGRYRVLQFADEAEQGVLDLDDPERVVLAYPRVLIELLDGRQERLSDLYMIGHGIGTIAGYYARRSAIRLRTAELDARLAALSREMFGYDGPEPEIGDGRELLGRLEPASLDAVLVDAFSAQGTPRRLTSLPFFELARRQLRGGGLLLMNLAGRKRGDWLMQAIHTTVATCFDRTLVLAPEHAAADEVTNLVLAASDDLIAYRPSGKTGFRPVELPPGHLIYDAQDDR